MPNHDTKDQLETQDMNAIARFLFVLILAVVFVYDATLYANDNSDQLQSTQDYTPLGLAADHDQTVSSDRHQPIEDIDPRTRQLNLLISVLHESKLDLTRRQEAAVALLELNDPNAIDLISLELRDNTQPTTQRLIAQAIVRLPQQPPPKLAQVLFNALFESDQSNTTYIAESLGRYSDPFLVDQLSKAASSETQNPQRRRAAILALGHHRSQKVAAILIHLIDKEKNQLHEDLQKAVYRSLSNLTGITSYGQNRHRWLSWWKEHQGINNQQWFNDVIRNFTLSRTRLATERQQVLSRLVDTQRQLYRSLPQEQRQQTLVLMLNDPLISIRQLAIDLCVQRLIDNRPINPEVRTALIPLLNDQSISVRLRATQLAHDLADSQASTVIAQRIYNHLDSDPELLRTQLLLLARLPQAIAVPRALDLLKTTEVSDAAAGFLAAAAEANLLDEQQAIGAADTLRERLKDRPTDTKPQYVTLLARIGTDKDWDLVAIWLDSGEESLKRAATTAWADSDHPLEPLLDRSDDPIIREIVVAAARRRGNTPQTLMALLAHQPKEEQALENWERAVLAVTKRVSTTAVIEADKSLGEQSAPLDLREKILTAAIENRPATDPNQPPTASEDDPLLTDPNHTNNFILSELLLARAAIRQAADDPVRALDDYEQVKQLRTTLSPRLQEAYQFGMLDAELATDAMDAALLTAEGIIRDASGSEGSEKAIGRVVDLFLVSVQRNLDEQELNQSQLVLTRLRELLGNSLTELLNQRLVELERKTNLDDPSQLNDSVTPSPIQPQDPATEQSS